MKMRTAALLVATPLALAAAERPSVKPVAKVTGEAENCLMLTHYRETRIRDDWTIDFLRDSRTGWRNELPHRCSGLRSNNGFTFGTSLSQVCSTDIIYVLENWGGSPRRGAGCGLGKFVPIEIEKDAK